MAKRLPEMQGTGCEISRRYPCYERSFRLLKLGRRDDQRRYICRQHEKELRRVGIHTELLRTWKAAGI